MNDTRRFKVIGWTVTLMARERLTASSGEIKGWISRGGDVVGGRETPYRSHDVFVTYWTRGKWARDRFDFNMRISNGEMAGVAFSVCLPLIGSVYLKLGAPRRLIKGWVLEGRDFGFTLGGHRGIEVRLAHEDDDMRGYYLRKIRSGESRPRYVGRYSLWRGLKLGLSGERIKRAILGRPSCACETVETGVTAIPMPEGQYPASWRRERRTWRRARLPFALRVRESVRLDIKPGIPVPGKGENSWDIDDDAICGTGGQTVSDAVGNAVSSALRSRSSYAGPGWVPDKGWPTHDLVA